MKFGYQNQITVINRLDSLAKPLSESIFESLHADEKADLMLESISLEDIESTLLYDLEPTVDIMLEAITTTKVRLLKTMNAFSRSLNTQLGPIGISVGETEIGRPRKSGAVAIMAAKIPLSDGQSVSLVFHAPDNDPLTINNDDTLIAFRFMLNSRDITHVVAPTGGQDVSLKQVTLALSNAVEKNTEKFKAAQGAKVELQAKIDSDNAQAEELESLISTTSDQIDELDSSMATVNKKAERIQKQINKQDSIQEELREKIASLNVAIEDDTSIENEPEVAPEPIDEIDTPSTPEVNNENETAISEEEFQAKLTGQASEQVANLRADGHQIFFDKDKGFTFINPKGSTVNTGSAYVGFTEYLDYLTDKLNFKKTVEANSGNPDEQYRDYGYLVDDSRGRPTKNSLNSMKLQDLNNGKYTIEYGKHNTITVTKLDDEIEAVWSVAGGLLVETKIYPNISQLKSYGTSKMDALGLIVSNKMFTNGYTQEELDNAAKSKGNNSGSSQPEDLEPLDKKTITAINSLKELESELLASEESKQDDTHLIYDDFGGVKNKRLLARHDSAINKIQKKIDKHQNTIENAFIDFVKAGGQQQKWDDSLLEVQGYLEGYSYEELFEENESELKEFTETNNIPESPEETNVIQGNFTNDDITEKVRSMSLAEFQRWAMNEKGMQAKIAEDLYNDTIEQLEQEHEQKEAAKPESVASRQFAEALKASDLKDIVRTDGTAKVYSTIDTGLYSLSIAPPLINETTNGMASFWVNCSPDNHELDTEFKVAASEDGTLDKDDLSKTIDSLVQTVKTHGMGSGVVDLSNLPEYGSKKDELDGNKEIASAVRKAIKSAIKDGKLPAIKTSVRAKDGSINVTITDIPDSIQFYSNQYLLAVTEGKENDFTYMRTIQTESDDVRAMLEFLSAELKQYHWDESDSMTDYFHSRFYAHVGTDYELEKIRKAKELNEIKENLNRSDQALAEFLDEPEEPETQQEEEPEEAEQETTKPEEKILDFGDVFIFGGARFAVKQITDDYVIAQDVEDGETFPIKKGDPIAIAFKFKGFNDGSKEAELESKVNSIVSSLDLSEFIDITNDKPYMSFDGQDTIYDALSAAGFSGDEPRILSQNVRNAFNMGQPTAVKYTPVEIEAEPLPSEPEQPESQSEEMGHIDNLKQIRDYSGDVTLDISTDFTERFEAALDYIEQNDLLDQHGQLVEDAGNALAELASKVSA